MSDKDKAKVTRGRSTASLPPAQAMSDQGAGIQSREEKAHSPGRPERVSMNNSLKLDFPDGHKEDGFYYRWFQDRNGRVNQAKAAYYEHVTDEAGNNLTRQSGPYTMYLMRLEEKYRDEDNRLKKKRVAATLEKEAAIGPGEYAPDQETGRAEGGKSAVSSKESDNPYS